MIGILVGVALLLASTMDASAQDRRIDSARDLFKALESATCGLLLTPHPEASRALLKRSERVPQIRGGCTRALP